MSLAFQSLPLELFLSLGDYLSITEQISLSHTCQLLRTVYGPSTWSRCSVVTKKHVSSIVISKQLLKVRCVPLSAVLNPEKYSWFLNQCVSEIWAETTEFQLIFKDIPKDRYGTVTQYFKKVFPNFKRVVIANYVVNTVHSLRNLSSFPLFTRYIQYKEGFGLTTCRVEELNIFCQTLQSRSQLFPEPPFSTLAKVVIRDSSADTSSELYKRFSALPPLNIPSIREVLFGIVDYHLALCVLPMFSALPNCREFLMVLNYRHDVYLQEEAEIDPQGVKFSPIFHHFDLLPQAPKITLHLSSLEHEPELLGQPPYQFPGYKTVRHFLQEQDTEKANGRMITAIKTYRNHCSGILSLVDFSNVVSIAHSSTDASIQSVRFQSFEFNNSTLFPNLTTLKYTISHRANYFYFVKALKNIPRLEEVRLNVEANWGSFEHRGFADFIKNGLIYLDLIPGGERANIYHEYQNDEYCISEIPEEDRQFFKEFAEAILVDDFPFKFKIKETPENDYRLEWNRYLINYCLIKAISITTLKRLILDSNYPNTTPIHPFTSYVYKALAENQSLEYVRMIGPMPSAKENFSKILVRHDPFNIPHILEQVNRNGVKSGIYEIHPKLLKYRHLMNEKDCEKSACASSLDQSIVQEFATAAEETNDGQVLEQSDPIIRQSLESELESEPEIDILHDPDDDNTFVAQNEFAYMARRLGSAISTHRESQSESRIGQAQQTGTEILEPLEDEPADQIPAPFPSDDPDLVHDVNRFIPPNFTRDIEMAPYVRVICGGPYRSWLSLNSGAAIPAGFIIDQTPVRAAVLRAMREDRRLVHIHRIRIPRRNGQPPHLIQLPYPEQNPGQPRNGNNEWRLPIMHRLPGGFLVITTLREERIVPNPNRLPLNNP